MMQLKITTSIMIDFDGNNAVPSASSENHSGGVKL
jgi:hypothetical protein